MCSNPDMTSSSSMQNDAAETHPQMHTRYKIVSRSAFAQILAILMQNCLLIEVGLDTAMPTMVIGALHKNPSETLNMNDDEASWFVSIPAIFYPLSSLTSGYVQELFGRKKAMLLVTIPTFTAWMILYFAQSIYTLYAASTLMALCNGLTEAAIHSYVGEIGEPHLRGTLSTISISAMLFGGLMMFVLGYFFDWRTVILICGAYPIITLMVISQLPESPTWLIVKNRREEAKRALCWLRGWVKPEEIEQEFQAHLSHAERSVSSSLEKLVPNGSLENLDYIKIQFTEMSKERVLRPLRMICVMFIICITAYCWAIRPYQIGELKKMGSPVDPKLVLIGAQVFIFVGLMMNVLFLRRFGKRRIAIFSCSIIAFCMFGIGFHHANLKGRETTFLAWLPVILWLTINCFAGFSAALLAWQLVSEVFPIVGRGLASGVSAAWSSIVVFVMIKSYLYIEVWIGLSGVMYLYGTVTALGVLYLYFYVPETEGKTLEQIESYFTDNHDPEEKFSIGKSK